MQFLFNGQVLSWSVPMATQSDSEVYLSIFICFITNQTVSGYTRACYWDQNIVRPRPKPRPESARPRSRPRPKICYETETKNYKTKTETETSPVKSIACESNTNRYVLFFLLHTRSEWL